jgi:hypothetical protein
MSCGVSELKSVFGRTFFNQICVARIFIAARAKQKLIVVEAGLLRSDQSLEKTLAQFSKNKTVKNLICKLVERIKRVSRRLRLSRPTKGSANGAVTPVREERQAAVNPNDALGRSRKAQLEKVARLSRAVRIKTNGTLWRGPAEGSKAARRKLSFVAGS